MRLWSIHPSYLDRQGLIAVWREGLLAKKVLEGKTRGYTNHPQLLRFRNAPSPLHAVNFYLGIICSEAEKRGFNFDRAKIRNTQITFTIPVSTGQLKYEIVHLKKKLKVRSPETLANLKTTGNVMPHPLFQPVPGPVALWEKTDRKKHKHNQSDL